MIILPKHLVHAQLTRQTKISQGRLNQLKQEKNNNTVLHGHTAFTTMVLVYIDIQHCYATQNGYVNMLMLFPFKTNNANQIFGVQVLLSNSAH